MEQQTASKAHNKTVKAFEIVLFVIAICVVVWLLLPPSIKSMLIPRITGSLTISDDTFEKTYKFSDRGAMSGSGICWEITELEQKPRISISWDKSWPVIRADFRAEHTGDEWLITGTVHLRGNKAKEYSYSIPYDEQIAIVIFNDELKSPHAP